MGTLIVYEPETDAIIHVKSEIKNPRKYAEIYSRVDGRYPDQELAYKTLKENLTYHAFCAKYQITDGVITPKVPTEAEIKNKAIGALAKHRWQVETGGYVWNDYPVASDDRAQTKLTQVALAITAGTRTGVRWKFSDGVWRELTAAEFIGMAEGLDAHCDLCFACEEACKTRIEAGEYDIETIWGEEWLTLNDTQTADDDEPTAETDELTVDTEESTATE